MLKYSMSANDLHSLETVLKQEAFIIKCILFKCILFKN